MKSQASNQAKDNLNPDYYKAQSLKKTILFEHTRSALKNPIAFLGTIARLKKPIVQVRIAGKKYLIIQDPDYLKYIFVDNHEAFTKYGITKILRFFFGEGLVTSNDEVWKTKRRLIQPAFHKEQLTGILKIVREETQGFIEKLNGMPQHSEININRELLALNVSIVFRALFGTSLDRQSQEMLQVLEALNQYATQWMRSPVKIPLNWPTPANRKFHQNCKRFDRIIYQVIQDRRASKGDQHHDLLSTLMDYKDVDSGEGMTDKQLRDEITTIFMAGHDTTSQTLSWILYELALNPRVHQKLKREVGQAFDPESVKIEHLSQLTCVNQVIMEGLRHYPAISAVLRKPREKVEVNGVKMKPSSNLLINIYGMHHHPDYWESPEKFNPERFNATADKNRPAFVYFPFGGGPRYCVGSGFARMVMQVVLSSLVRHFEFRVPDGFSPQIEPNITLKAKGGIRLVLQRA